MQRLPHHLQPLVGAEEPLLADCRPPPRSPAEDARARTAISIWPKVGDQNVPGYIAVGMRLFLSRPGGSAPALMKSTSVRPQLRVTTVKFSAGSSAAARQSRCPAETGRSPGRHDRHGLPQRRRQSAGRRRRIIKYNIERLGAAINEFAHIAAIHLAALCHAKGVGVLLDEPRQVTILLHKGLPRSRPGLTIQSQRAAAAHRIRHPRATRTPHERVGHRLPHPLEVDERSVNRGPGEFDDEVRRKYAQLHRS